MPHDDLIAFADQIHAQTREVEEMLESLDEACLGWRPEPGRWSIAEHLAHLVVVNRTYVDAIGAAVDRARREGLEGPGPYRHGWLGNLFVRVLEPPVRLRVRTLRAMEPGPAGPAGSLRAGFRAAQGGIVDALAAADGIDLGRARLRSPFFRRLQLSVGQAFSVIAAHNRRHLWHVRRLLAHPDFPGETP